MSSSTAAKKLTRCWLDLCFLARFGSGMSNTHVLVRSRLAFCSYSMSIDPTCKILDGSNPGLCSSFRCFFGYSSELFIPQRPLAPRRSRVHVSAHETTEHPFFYVEVPLMCSYLLRSLAFKISLHWYLSIFLSLR